MSEASRYLIHYRNFMPNFKLKTVAKVLGIDLQQNKLHNAYYDVQLTMKIYEKTMKGNILKNSNFNTKRIKKLLSE